jgi:two-component system, LuxR family, response regulator FixJ
VSAVSEPSLIPTRRIVIIDDEPAFVDTLSAMVLSLGYEVTVSPDARSSDTFDLTDDDVVFLDVLMPNSSGLQVLDQLALQKATCPIVLMSGHLERLDEAEKYAESLDLNLIGALEKPFRLDDVKDVLSNH